MPRTTLLLEDDALKVARAHAARHGLTIGEAVSDLVRKAADRPLLTDDKNGLKVVRLGRRSSRVTTTQVNELRDEMP